MQWHIRDLRERLARWNKAPDLASVRDPTSLAAMPRADRKAWESLWSAADALLVSITQRLGPSQNKP